MFVITDILPIAYGLYTPVLMCLTEKRVVVQEHARLSEKTDRSGGAGRGSGTSAGTSNSNAGSGSGSSSNRRYVAPLKEASHMDLDPTTTPLLPAPGVIGETDKGGLRRQANSSVGSYGPEEEDIPIPGYKATDSSGWGGYVSYWTGGGTNSGSL